jgi:hypothetical protein
METKLKQIALMPVISLSFIPLEFLLLSMYQKQKWKRTEI